MTTTGTNTKTTTIAAGSGTSKKRPATTPTFAANNINNDDDYDEPLTSSSGLLLGLASNNNNSNKVARRTRNNDPRNRQIIIIDEDEEEETKVVTTAAAAKTCIRPMTPIKNNVVGTNDPSSSSCWIDPMKGLTFVIYLAIDEPLNSGYTRGLDICRNHCNPQIQNMCFQMDQTRHVSLTGPIKLSTLRQAHDISFTNSNSIPTRPIAIAFDGLQPWKGGIYLKLSKSTTITLKKILHDGFVGSPYERTVGNNLKCDHLSLYRKRNAPTSLYYSEISKLKKKLSNHNWGSDDVAGVSIRIKQVGTDYNQCRVLWSSSSSSSS